LMDEVLPQADGTVIVGSCSDPMQTYRLSGHTCECKDFTDGKAPQSWCKHRIAAGIHKRVGELLPQSTPVGTETPPPPLPEAPASVNLKVLMSGHEVMVTLRDQSEDALLGRLQALLKRTDIRPIPKPAPRSGSWKRSNQGR